MKKIQKGQFGYLSSQFRRELLKTIFLFLSSFSILLIGMVVTKQRNEGISWSESRNNILTVAAVLGLLPAARSLISTIMFGRAKKNSCPADLWASLQEIETKKKVLPLFCADLYFTAYDAVFPVYAMAATGNEMFGFLSAGSDAAKAQEHIRTALQKDGQKNVTVKLFQDRDKFLERAMATANANSEEKDTKAAAAHMEVALQISL